jgi:hypothetical protein
MQTMPPKIVRFILVGAALVLFSCQRRDGIPIDINLPPDATDAHSRVTPDNSLREVTFTVQSKRDSLATASQIESQLMQGGYVRCTGGKGNWEVISKHQDGKIIEENRLLLFFKTSNPRQLGVIFARQICDTKQIQCKEEFLVRQINIPPSIVDGDKYVSNVCENRTQIGDPTVELKFQ